MEIILVEQEQEPQWNILCMIWNYLLKLGDMHSAGSGAIIPCSLDSREMNMQEYVSTIMLALRVLNHIQHNVTTVDCREDSVSRVPAAQA